VTFDISMIDEEIFAEGTMFDGSSIAGWKAINESDMCLMPDPVTATIDPFFAETTMVITCDVLEPTTGEPYNRDPRGMARKAEAMVKSMGIGDTVFVGPEAEFFVFDDVRYEVKMNSCFYEFSSDEGPYVTGRILPEGNAGHRPPIKGGYFPVPPVDSCQDIRSEMLSIMGDMGIEPEKHHHEVAPSQHEIDLRYKDVLTMADQVMTYRLTVKEIAQAKGLYATFMPISTMASHIAERMSWKASTGGTGK
jgi:glutamine synthetase